MSLSASTGPCPGGKVLTVVEPSGPMIVMVMVPPDVSMYCVHVCPSGVVYVYGVPEGGGVPPLCEPPPLVPPLGPLKVPSVGSSEPGALVAAAAVLALSGPAICCVAPHPVSP